MSQTELPSTIKSKLGFCVAYQLPEADSARLGYLSVPNRHDIFVAYTPENAETVRSLDDAIRDVGLEPWIGELLDLLSPNPDRIIQEGIQDSDALILLMGKDGTIPADLQDELEQALALNRLVILVSRSAIKAEPLQPYNLSRLTVPPCHPLSLPQVAEAIFIFWFMLGY
ncbi:MAG: TIR domain-containing protein [Leptolyngbyaceae cyanobacterium SM2_5_2]|nr:TIR domain-containing protein [Leptolyngbyaceae cyanobacterium SM2_5_2]